MNKTIENLKRQIKPEDIFDCCNSPDQNGNYLCTSCKFKTKDQNGNYLCPYCKLKTKDQNGKYSCTSCKFKTKLKKRMVDHSIEEHGEEYQTNFNNIVRQKATELFDTMKIYLSKEDILKQIQKVKDRYNQAKEDVVKRITSKSELMGYQITWIYQNLCYAEAEYIIASDLEDFILSLHSNLIDGDKWFIKRFHEWFENYKSDTMKRMNLNNSTSAISNVYHVYIANRQCNELTNFGLLFDIQSAINIYKDLEEYFGELKEVE